MPPRPLEVRFGHAPLAGDALVDKGLPISHEHFDLALDHARSVYSCAPAPTATHAKSALDTDSTLKFLAAAAMRVRA